MRRGSPGRVVLTNLVLASFMTAVWLPLLLALLDFSSFGTDRGTSAAVLMIVFGGLILAFGVSPAATLASIVTIWAYPLLGATRRQDGAVEAWVSLDRVDPAWSPAAPQVRVRSSVVMGVVVGLALVAVLLSLRLLLHAVVAEEVRNTDAWVLQFLLWSVLIATLLQVMASVPAALMARTLRALHGLLAAAVTGVFGVVGIVGGIGVGSCIPVFSVRPSQRCSFAVEPEFLWQVLHQVLRAGGLAALLIGLLIAAVARRDPPGRSAPTTQSRVVALDPDLETMQGQR